jgi:hypothetical protein
MAKQVSGGDSGGTEPAPKSQGKRPQLSQLKISNAEQTRQMVVENSPGPKPQKNPPKPPPPKVNKEEDTKSS